MKKSILAITLLATLSGVAGAANYQAGDIVVRGGITNVTPNDEKSAIYLAGSNSSMSLTADGNSQLGLNFVYFHDHNWAVEILAATPFTHDVTIQDTNAILGVDGAKLAEVTHLPPTVSALYYFDTTSAFKPYIGAGLSYVIFFEEEFEAAPKSLGLSELKLEDSFGYSVQLGGDYLLNDQWHINASVRYIALSTNAKFDVGGDNIGKAEIDLDPMVYSLMVGYKF